MNQSMCFCPKCGSADCVSRVTDRGQNMSCAHCGLRRNVRISPHPKFGHFIAPPTEQLVPRKLHAHQYIGALLAFVALGALLLFMQFAKLL